MQRQSRQQRESRQQQHTHSVISGRNEANDRIVPRAQQQQDRMEFFPRQQQPAPRLTFSPLGLKPLLGPVTSEKDRKKSFQATARYYSECSMRGIAPTDADKAAVNVDQQYGKWWPSKRKRSESSKTTTTSGPVSPSKKQRRQLDAAARNVSYTGTTTDDDDSVVKPTASMLNVADSTVQKILAAKAAIIEELQSNGGNTTTHHFLESLDTLQEFYKSQGHDARWSQSSQYCCMDGVWLTLSGPTYSECLGRNVEGDYMYTLGRLAFDMFRPTGLRCSLQGIYQQVGLDDDRSHDRCRTIPARLLRERQARLGAPPVRTNDILMAFTIEPDQTRRGKLRNQDSSSSNKSTPSDEYIVQRPLRALLTNHGYCLPDPDVPNRLSIWFSGGRLEPDIEEGSDIGCSLDEWNKLFDETKAPNRNFEEMARILAARCFLGAHLPEQVKPDGSMNYSLQRPIGGHGQVYVDVLYCDETMRIIAGHQGSIFVSIRPLESDMVVETEDD